MQKNIKNMLTGHADIAQNTFGSSTVVGENFEIQCSQTTQNAFNLSTMVGENF